MEKQREHFDAWMQTQKEFMDNWLKSQRTCWENVAESTKKMQEFCMRSGLVQPQGWAEGAPQKEAMEMYNTMVETIVNSSKAYTDETIKMQEAMRHTVDQQMEMCRKMAESFFDFGKQKVKEAA